MQRHSFLNCIFCRKIHQGPSKDHQDHQGSYLFCVLALGFLMFLSCGSTLHHIATYCRQVSKPGWIASNTSESRWRPGRISTWPKAPWIWMNNQWTWYEIGQKNMNINVMWTYMNCSWWQNINIQKRWHHMKSQGIPGVFEACSELQ